MKYEVDIRERTFEFAVRIVRMCRDLRRDLVNSVLLKQLLRAGTSIGANLEEARGAYSKKDFVHSINIAKKEARETNYWLRLIFEVSPEKLRRKMKEILKESEEIIKILTVSVKKAQKNLN